MRLLNKDQIIEVMERFKKENPNLSNDEAKKEMIKVIGEKTREEERCRGWEFFCKTEQELRQKSISSIRSNLTSHLENVVIQHPDGTRRKLKKKN